MSPFYIREFLRYIADFVFILLPVWLFPVCLSVSLYVNNFAHMDGLSLCSQGRIQTIKQSISNF